MIERRFVPAEGEVGLIRGIAAAWGRVPSFREIVEPGAFAASLSRHAASGIPVPMVWAHDPREPIGIWTDLREGPAGLMAEGRIIVETQRGREARALIQGRAVTALSIGFRTIRAEAAPEGWRRLREVELVEISLVPVPANPGARISEVRADPGSFIAACRSAARMITVTRNQR